MCKIVRRGPRRGDVASVAMSGFFSLEPRFSRGCMKEELLGEILRPVAKALGWIVAGALVMLFVYAVVVYVVPALRRHVHGNE